MKILAIADEEHPGFWDHYRPGKLAGYDLIVSCGDLKAEYLSFLVTMARCPLLYVHGNHDTHYAKKHPEGCDCIDDQIVTVNGVRILGLGGCRRYNEKGFHYTEADMARRIRRLRWRLWRTGGVDIVVTHAPPEGLGDGEDPAHWGFACLRQMLDKYRPKYLLHGHVHLRYQTKPARRIDHADTAVINCTGHYELEIPDGPCPPQDRGRVIWKTRFRDPYPGE